MLDIRSGQHGLGCITPPAPSDPRSRRTTPPQQPEERHDDDPRTESVIRDWLAASDHPRSTEFVVDAVLD
jgi:hypothetical protein